MLGEAGLMSVSRAAASTSAGAPANPFWNCMLDRGFGRPPQPSPEKAAPRSDMSSTLHRRQRRPRTGCIVTRRATLSTSMPRMRTPAAPQPVWPPNSAYGRATLPPCGEGDAPVAIDIRWAPAMPAASKPEPEGRSHRDARRRDLLSPASATGWQRSDRSRRW
jgi:hypothetical protein